MLMTRQIRRKNEMGEEESNGFTVLEMVVVLSFLTVMIAILPPFFQSTIHTIEKEQILDQFQADVYLAQQTAITLQEPVLFQYFSSLNEYRFRLYGGDEVIISRHFSDNISMEGRMIRFYFHPNGDINKFGSLFIRINGKDYRVVFQIERGRIYIYD